ncbi:MAG: CopD family protein [Brevundimonas sp.]|uniref:CopD family protein n=1 Tax=Brevundimonas sp. TaxID=1871086 RepID=UPI003918EDA6
MNAYDLARALHILAVIAWMAGLLYLPRLYIYHVKAAPGGEMDQTFQTMERKLLKLIMNPSMIAAWVFGLWLFWLLSGSGADWSFAHQPWMVAKIAGVLFLTGWHHYLGVARKRFAAGTNQRSERYWRMTNELPFIAAIVMVLSVTLEWTF